MLNIADRVLKVVAAPAASSTITHSEIPVDGNYDDADLSKRDRDYSSRLMRINHAGETAAQGLYQGHALVARNPGVSAHLEQSAREEYKHLLWCRERLYELGGRTSLLTPFWYGGALSIGIAAGLWGDRWSLGFVRETEDQVTRHLTSHLSKISCRDKKTIAILERIKADEKEHGENACRLGGRELPESVKCAMRCSAKVMTTTAYYL